MTRATESKTPGSCYRTGGVLANLCINYKQVATFVKYLYNKSMKRILVIFDGSNFYHYAKRMMPSLHLTHYNYVGLVEQITGSKKSKIEYCVGEVRKSRQDNSLKLEKLYANQQVLFYNLERQGIEIKKGYLLRNKLSYQEKGVDVRIALDVLRGALKDEYDFCYIISSDSDLVPAVKDAMEAEKEVIYVGFQGNIGRAMLMNCSGSFTITKDLLKKFKNVRS